MKINTDKKIKIITDNKNIVNFRKLNMIKIEEEKNIKVTLQLEEDLSKFYFLFQNLIVSFLKNKKNKEKSIKCFRKFGSKIPDCRHIHKKKNSLYAIKNFRKFKEKAFFWFCESTKNRFFLKSQNNKKINGLFNVKTLLKLISKELNKNKITGFSKKAIEFILENLEKTIENMLIEMGKLSIRRRNTKKIAIDWGTNNLIGKKIKKNCLQSKHKFQDEVNQTIRKYKIKKKLSEPLVKKDNTDINVLKENIGNKNNEKHSLGVEDIVSKANKTLMTLLHGILQNRVGELKKATSCLCSYHPVEIKYNLKKEEKKKEFIQEKKEKCEEKPTKIKNKIRILPDLSKSTWYLTGVDCFLFLKENKTLQSQTLSMSLLSILISDFNLRFEKNSARI